MMDFEAVLRRLTRVTGVRAAMVVDAEAGVPVASEMVDGIGETALAALAGALFRRTSGAAQTAGFGALRAFQLDSNDGYLVVAGAPPLLVVTVTEPGAQIGLVRVEARRAVEELTR